MNTQANKAMIAKRHQFMEQYLDPFCREWEVDL